MQTHIRSIGKAEAATLAVLHAASFGAAAWNKDQFECGLALETTHGWAAVEDSAIVGFILAQMLPGEAEILTLAVAPSHQRRGLATALLQKLIEVAQAIGSARIFLEVAADNQGAVKLYDAHAFVRRGSRKGYYRRGDATMDAVLYERILSEQ